MYIHKFYNRIILLMRYTRERKIQFLLKKLFMYNYGALI